MLLLPPLTSLPPLPPRPLPPTSSPRRASTTLYPQPSAVSLRELLLPLPLRPPPLPSSTTSRLWDRSPTDWDRSSARGMTSAPNSRTRRTVGSPFLALVAYLFSSFKSPYFLHLARFSLLTLSFRTRLFIPPSGSQSRAPSSRVSFLCLSLGDGLVSVPVLARSSFSSRLFRFILSYAFSLDPYLLLSFTLTLSISLRLFLYSSCISFS